MGNSREFISNEECDYDRGKDVKEFDETKTGVKGLIDSGILKIPRIFIHPQENLHLDYSRESSGSDIGIPIINLEGLENYRRAEIVNDICDAASTWGFFQMVNHGIPLLIMEEMIQGVKRFHEQPKEAKMEWYSRDPGRKIRYHSNGNLHTSKAANWRDSLACNFDDAVVHSHTLPLACREQIGNYTKCLIQLKDILCELLSEALGIRRDFLANIDCMKTLSLVCHYYPYCPEPDLTLGATKHSDPSFLTLLLQDNIGGLQVLYNNKWVDVNPIKGALIANIGDLMQLITNDKFKSVEHRVLAQRVGPRISVAGFFYPNTANSCRPYGPQEEFLSDKNPPIYRETDHKEYHAYYKSKGLEGTSALPHFKLQQVDDM